jgi:hypothetical protein
VPVTIHIPEGIEVDPSTIAAQVGQLGLDADHLTARRLDVAADVFETPTFDRLTPLHEDTATGRISGHIASLGVCHTGIRGACVTAPLSKLGWVPASRYDFVANGEQLVAVGRLSHGANHFGRGSYGQAIAYHDPLTHHAYGAFGADTHGIWFSGTRDQLVADSRVREALSMPHSGDWRRFRGNLELTDVLTVDDPGYPVDGHLVASKDGMIFDYLVAVGIVSGERPCGCTESQVDQELLDSITAGLVLTDGPVGPPSGAEVVYGDVSYAFEEQLDDGAGGQVWVLFPLVTSPSGLERDYSNRIAVPAGDCTVTGKRWEWQDTADARVMPR